MSILNRRHKKSEPELEITAFLNLMVVLVPFLLITAVFTQVSVIELNLPPPSDATPPQQEQKETLDLEVIIRADNIEIADSKRGLIRSFAKAGEAHDYKAISQLLQELKRRFPDKTNAMILAEPEVNYDTLVQVMDTVRLFEGLQAGSVEQFELFPDMAIGDAPVLKKGK